MGNWLVEMLFMSGRHFWSINFPDEKTNQKVGSGLSSLAINIPQFHMINEMPIVIDICRIDDGDGTESTLVT